MNRNITDFPQPVRLGNSTRWNPADLAEWEARHGLNLPPLTGLADVRQVADRYSISVPSVWRWAQQSRSESANG